MHFKCDIGLHGGETLAADIQEILSLHLSSPLWLFIGIVLISYLLEDLAIVLAAGLAVEGYLPSLVAIVAIFVGITTGDLALYWLGKYGQSVRFLRYHTLKHKAFRQVRGRIQSKAFVSLFVIRFIPGLRTLGYTLSGYCLVPMRVFLLAVMLASALWVGGVFGSVYWLGSQAFLAQSSWLWCWVLGAFLLLTVMNRVVSQSWSKGKISI
ncbi:DedA family protein [Vibrio vulnificus]|nr:DedA family protein [Vibrio vulnificus]EGQ7929808.1 DedA family protein [Vibrio vulnificus]EGQ7933881.1 DedA family protein [Vibrio vulnificus]EGQ7949764.1 DedA family protein [Vibrio vulnificus]EGQ7989589.1 DedA family protein [Vibrio vulnificus]EGQ9281032.1 DedA family protein [Vibrio vulnificus]